MAMNLGVGVLGCRAGSRQVKSLVASWELRAAPSVVSFELLYSFSGVCARW